MITFINDDLACVARLTTTTTTTTRRLSRIALLLAEQSDRLGLHDDAARLFDLSGHDDRLAAYLNGRIQAVSHLDRESPPTDDEEELAAVKERLRALASAREAAGLTGSGAGKGAGDGGAAAFADLFRRASLLAGVPRLPQVGYGRLRE